jgi:hypothetical protein
MQTLLVEIESESKALELTSILSSMNFVKKVSPLKNNVELIEALQEVEMIKTNMLNKKNKAFAKYL